MDGGEGGRTQGRLTNLPEKISLERTHMFGIMQLSLSSCYCSLLGKVVKLPIFLSIC